MPPSTQTATIMAVHGQLAGAKRARNSMPDVDAIELRAEKEALAPMPPSTQTATKMAVQGQLAGTKRARNSMSDVDAIELRAEKEALAPLPTSTQTATKNAFQAHLAGVKLARNSTSDIEAILERFTAEDARKENRLLSSRASVPSGPSSSYRAWVGASPTVIRPPQSPPIQEDEIQSPRQEKSKGKAVEVPSSAEKAREAVRRLASGESSGSLGDIPASTLPKNAISSPLRKKVSVNRASQVRWPSDDNAFQAPSSAGPRRVPVQSVNVSANRSPESHTGPDIASTAPAAPAASAAPAPANPVVQSQSTPIIPPTTATSATRRPRIRQNVLPKVDATASGGLPPGVAQACDPALIASTRRRSGRLLAAQA